MSQCRKCYVELTDENWYPCHKIKHNRICNKCHLAYFRQHYRKPEVRARWIEHSKEWHQRNPDKAKVSSMRYRLKKLGLVLEDYQTMLEKCQNKCEICGNEFKEREPQVDHDHKTGNVRGLLCNNCNSLLGFLENNNAPIEKFVQYLNNDWM
jgi:hypothetical protein